MIKPKYLYHGSQHKVDILIPHTAKGLPEENGTEFGIYAYEKSDIVCPFTLDIKPYKNGTMSFHGDDLTGVTTIFAGTLDENSKGYIYKVSSDSFERIDDHQWLSKIPIVPVEIKEVYVKDFIDKIFFKGSAKEIHQIADSIASCGLVCNLCHFADNCGGCKSDANCCGVRKTAGDCYQYDCCSEKCIDGCWECDIAPCDKGMFSDSHDVRLRAFIKYIKENSRNRLAERLYFNMQNGIHYGHNKDYDGLGSIDEVIEKLEVLK